MNKETLKTVFLIIIYGGGRNGGRNLDFEKGAGKVAIFGENLAVFQFPDLVTLVSITSDSS